jgi:hypothetical protein
LIPTVQIQGSERKIHRCCGYLCYSLPAGVIVALVIAAVGEGGVFLSLSFSFSSFSFSFSFSFFPFSSSSS